MSGDILLLSETYFECICGIKLRKFGIYLDKAPEEP